MLKALLLGAAICALGAGSASATIVIQAGPSFVQPDENVLLNGPVMDNVALGETNQTQTVVVLTGNEDVVTPPQGQARIEAVDGGLTFLAINLQNPLLGFSEFEFNLDASADGSVTLSFFDQLGNVFNQDFALDASGQNFFGATALDGQLITKVGLLSTVDLNDVQQIRLGPIAVIPEPATWGMMILGFGVAGTMIRRQRRLNSLLAA